MAIILDTLLIGKTDFDNIKDISLNMDDKILNGYINEAQTTEIKAFLGEPLYAAVVNDPTSIGPPNYAKLLDGGDYQNQGRLIKFNGLRIVLVYYAWARIAKTNQTSVTRYGVKSKQEGDDSIDTPVNIVEQKVRDARALGVKFQSEVYDFLSQNQAEYTLWDTGENNQPRRAGFNFSRV